MNPGKQGTKVAAHYTVKIGAGQSKVIRLRLSSTSAGKQADPSASRSKTSSPTGFVRPTSSNGRRPR